GPAAPGRPAAHHGTACRSSPARQSPSQPGRDAVHLGAPRLRFKAAGGVEEDALHVGSAPVGGAPAGTPQGPAPSMSLRLQRKKGVNGPAASPPATASG